MYTLTDNIFESIIDPAFVGVNPASPARAGRSGLKGEFCLNHQVSKIRVEQGKLSVRVGHKARGSRPKCGDCQLPVIGNNGIPASFGNCAYSPFKGE